MSARLDARARRNTSGDRDASAPQDARAQRDRYWPLPLARAVPAAVLALGVTFSADHSARFGLLAFGCFATVTGIIVALGAGKRLAHTGVRPYFIASGVVSVVFGVLALVAHRGGIATLLLVVTGWAALTGGLELYSGFRTRARHVASADWVTVGLLTALAALVFVLLPPDFVQNFTGPDGVPRALDAAVVAVGLLGAYSAIIAVYLVIAGISAKLGPQTMIGATDDAGALDASETDAVKANVMTADGVTTDAAKTGAVNTDAVKPSAVKCDAVKTDAVKGECT